MRRFLLKMFFLRFNPTALPAHCEFFRGPHNVDCLATIWSNAGCRMEGAKHPYVASFNENRVASSLNIKYAWCQFLLIQ